MDEQVKAKPSMAKPTTAALAADHHKAISAAATSLGYTLKPEQERGLQEFVAGKDVFISLPTGFGKSLCYILLPRIFDTLREVDRKSITLVVSPLIALMKDQVATITALGLSATYVTDKKSMTHSVRQGLRNGEYQITFVSPEALFLSTEWRNILSSDIYREHLVGFVIDEAHCIKKWGEKFRTEFSHLDEIRSIIPETVRVMALTATATKTTRKFIIKSLCMQAPAIIYVPPVRSNILYMVKDKPEGGIDEFFKPMVENLKVQRCMGRVIIFCKTYNNIISIYKFFKAQLGEYFTEPKGSPNYVINRVVDIYTHCTHETVKNKIITQFTKPSPLRVVIATIAFGMGINCPDVRHVIHWGVPADAEMYVQESGRAGRDGKLSCATILKRSSDLDKRYTTQHMIEYCTNKSLECRRSLLFQDFYDCNFTSTGCKCCDICLGSCNCGECDINIISFSYY